MLLPFLIPDYRWRGRPPPLVGVGGGIPDLGSVFVAVWWRRCVRKQGPELREAVRKSKPRNDFTDSVFVSSSWSSCENCDRMKNNQ